MTSLHSRFASEPLSDRPVSLNPSTGRSYTLDHLWSRELVKPPKVIKVKETCDEHREISGSSESTDPPHSPRSEPSLTSEVDDGASMVDFFDVSCLPPVHQFEFSSEPRLPDFLQPIDVSNRPPFCEFSYPEPDRVPAFLITSPLLRQPRDSYVRRNSRRHSRAETFADPRKFLGFPDNKGQSRTMG